MYLFMYNKVEKLVQAVHSKILNYIESS